MTETQNKVLVRGGGDLATAVIQKLFKSGFKVVVSELENPKMVRRTVSFSSAIYEGTHSVEGIEAIYCKHVDEIDVLLNANKIPVLTCNEDVIMEAFKPDIFVDATLSKKKVNYSLDKAEIVVGLGPEINAGVDAHVVIETARGHDLGRLIFAGYAKENTHCPGDIAGYTTERVLRSPCDGVIKSLKRIGDHIEKNETIAFVNDMPVISQVEGVLRGLIHDNVEITKGMKVGDVDPRGITEYCYTISEKGRNIAGGVLEAILWRRDVFSKAD
ncbi:MAG: EF2563 family selenium-dependent molybdenum hydroxylase system protein [Clostridiales bacterium]|nr:EF2563 family selenium-dependent molybdenum hydroxylase system protein [Clostridiales bacterium]